MVTYKLVLDIIDMLQTCLSHRHVCTLIHVNNHCQVMQTISQVVLTPLVIIIIIMFVNIALFKQLNANQIKALHINMMCCLII